MVHRSKCEKSSTSVSCEKANERHIHLGAVRGTPAELNDQRTRSGYLIQVLLEASYETENNNALT